MNVHAKLPAHLLAIEDFLAFVESRPDEERWELIEGEPVLSPSANRRHQIIVGNLLSSIRSKRKPHGTAWEVIPGIGVKLSLTSAPVPDLLIRPFDNLEGHVCDDVIVAFEVLSSSTADHDLRWKRRNYATLPSLQHYVVVAQDDVEVLVFDRATDFAERRTHDIEASLALPALGLSLALRDIYENAGVAHG